MSGTPLDDALARPKFGAGDAVPRLQAIAKQLPDATWLQAHRAIHVTGSQGKGTVTTLAAALFNALGISCGRFISPHLFKSSERIWIDGAPLSAQALSKAARAFADQERAYCRARPNETFGGFEAVTALAFNAFAHARVETAVLEAGIGGRHDATRAGGGMIAALTGIDLEHTAILGSRREDILEDKADICPPGGLLIAGALAPDLRAHLDAYARTRDITVEHLGDDARTMLRTHAQEGAVADFKIGDMTLDNVRTRLFGTAQLENAALALLLVKRWLERYGRWPGSDTFARAARAMFSGASLPLRFERIAGDPVTVIDVAHTGAAMDALTSTMVSALGTTKAVFLIGISSDKSPQALLAPLESHAAAFVFTQARHRGLDPHTFARHVPRAPAQICPDPAEALKIAQDEARARACPLIVTGSVFLAAEIKTIAAGNDPAALRFS